MKRIQYSVKVKMRLEKNFTHNVHLQHGMDTEMPTHLARNLSNKEKNTVHITTTYMSIHYSHIVM